MRTEKRSRNSSIELPVKVPKQMSSTDPTTSQSPSAPAKKRLSLSNSNESNRIKKLILKPKLRTVVSKDLSSFSNDGIITLTRAVRAITSNPPQPVPESLQALFQLCEMIILNGRISSQLLYDKIKMEIEKQAGGIRKSLNDIEATQSEESWLRVLKSEWKRYCDGLILVRSVFLGLDRGFILSSTGLLSIWDLGLDLFKNSVIENELVREKVSKCFIALINRERDGDQVDRSLLKDVIGLLQTLSVQSSQTIFVTPFLESSRIYYQSESSRLSTSLSSASYLGKVHERLQEELERCELVLGSDLKKEVEKIVLDSMVLGVVDGIATKEAGGWIEEEKKVELSSAFVLLQKVDNLPILRDSFREFVKAAGLAIVMNQAGDEKMVPNLISYRNKIINVVKDCFNNHSLFTGAVSLAFEFFINKRENKPAEMMAKFLDSKLRTGNKGLLEEDLENSLADVLALFRFTQGKDIFEAFYKKDLAKRLLLGKSASFDAERSMLLKLKDECGAGFTAKLEIMFTDIDLSTEIMKLYTATTPSTLSVNILSQGNWPTYPPSNPRIPESMIKSLERFKGFYVGKHSGRTLKWQHNLDQLSLKANFGKGGKKELAVSLFQGLVLLLFNEVLGDGQLNYKEILEATRLDPIELKRTLQSLACGKVRVLIKSPKGREIAETDEFSFNSGFKDDHIKIKINQIQLKETAEENKSTTDRVFTDRSSHLQLAIVRIMKARKTLKYNELVMETITQIGTRFKVETAEIKKSLSSLIDREYLRRNEDDSNLFEYLA